METVEYSASESIIPKSDLLRVTVLAAPASSSSQLLGCGGAVGFLFWFHVVVGLRPVGMVPVWSGHVRAAGVADARFPSSFLWALAAVGERSVHGPLRA